MLIPATINSIVIPLEQGLRHRSKSVALGVSFYSIVIPLEQGLRQTSLWHAHRHSI